MNASTGTGTGHTVGERTASAAVPFFLGVLPFGSTVDEATSYAVLDRFREAGGTLLDTANNYAAWVPGCTGDESENLLGGWFRSRGARDEMYLATKLGAREDPRLPGTFPANAEGLSAPAVRAAAEGSLRRLGTDRVDLLYAHIDDPATPVEETVRAFAGLVEEGSAAALGCSNHAVWRIERARAAARALGLPGYGCVQQRYTYLRPAPGADFGVQRHMEAELLDYAAGDSGLALMAYSSLLFGAYTRPDKSLPEQYVHPDSEARLRVLRESAAELGVSANQLVLAWLWGGTPRIVPVVGVSSVAQLDECLAAVDLVVPEEVRKRLDGAGA